MQRSPTGFWLLQIGGWLLFAGAMSLGRAGEWPAAIIVLIEWPFAALDFLTTLLLDRAFGRLPLDSASSVRMLGIVIMASWLAGMLWTAPF